MKFWQQDSTQSKLITRLNEVCDIIEIVLETTYYRIFTKPFKLRFLRSHFKKKKSGAYVIGFKIASPMLDAQITDFVMLITFVMVPAASLHKLAQSPELVLGETVSGDMLEFKVCTQVKSDHKLEEKSVAYQLGLSLTESVCNLKTYLKLAQFNVDRSIAAKKPQKQA